MFDGGEQLQQLIRRRSSTSSPPTTPTPTPTPFLSPPTNYTHLHPNSSTYTFFDALHDPPPPPPYHSFLHYPPPTRQSTKLLHHPKHMDDGAGFHHMNMEEEEVVIDEQIMNPAWSPHELLALFRIRSTWFPHQFTWEHVSRKMAEMGYKRSADKCKQKFELESTRSCFNNNNNTIHPNSTTANNNNNNNYRIFTELDEFCHAGRGDDHKVDDDDQQKLMIPPPPVNNPTDDHQQLIVLTNAADKDHSIIMMGQDLELQDTQNYNIAAPTTAHHHALPISNDDGQLELDDDQNKKEEEEGTVKRKRVEEEEEEENKKKKKKKKKMKKQKTADSKFEMLKGLCEEMVKKLMAQQEEMHNRLIQDMVKRDEEKVKREECWKKQEMERMKKELDSRAKDQQIAGDRQTTLLNFLTKLAPPPSSHHPTPNNKNPPTSSTSSSSSSSLAVVAHQNPSSTTTTMPDEKDARHTSTSSSNLSDHHQLPKTSPNNTAVTIDEKEDHGGGGGKRWPRDEVLALINIRCNMSSSSSSTTTTNDHHHQDQTSSMRSAPLWERISQGMLEMGYKRSAKRCKEKWENINKYFRKTKDSSKKRSLDSRTCPYFHQLTTLYNQGKLSQLPENGHSDDQPAAGDVLVDENHAADHDHQLAPGFDFEL